MTPYYSHGGITIYHGDCREVLPRVRADLCVTDPPYGTQDLGGGYGRRQNWSTDGRLGRTIANDTDLSAFMAAWALLPATGCRWVEAFFAPRKTPQFMDVVRDNWVGELVWDALGPGLGYTVRYQHESVAVMRLDPDSKPLHPIISVLRCSAASTADHPHAKPVDLMGRLIAWLPGEVVIDPFMGSGTTLRAAKDLGRHAIGIEIEERYCEIAATRLEQEVLDFGGAA